MHDSAVAEAKFRGLLEVAPDAMVTVDDAGTIVLVNGQVETLFGYGRDELLGKSVDLLLPERFQGGHEAHRSGYTALPRIRPMGANLDLYAKRKDGSEFPVEISLGPVDVDGNLMIISAIRDITERKQIEAGIKAARQEAEMANQAKNDFLSRMSHELRTPLNAILGFGQLLEMEQLEAEQKDSVGQILRAGRHLLELINEVLDISRIEAGHLSLSPEPVGVESLLHETQDLVRPLANDHNLQLESGYSAPGLFVLADRQRLRQVVLNLLTNAVKYNRPGGTVTVSCERREGAMLRISVADSGKGIDAAQMPRLFTPFERLGAEQTAVEGTGLGLALSQRLVEVMGGKLSVESVLGTGSTFHIDLPECASPLSPEAESSANALTAIEPTPGAEKTILYIEDNIASFQLMERIFSHWPSVRLLAAMQGRLGLDLARQHHPDLLLLDLHLPDIMGLEVLQRLRADPATRDIPVIVTSADATPSQIERLLAAGADEYITKPLDIPQFADLVRKHLK